MYGAISVACARVAEAAAGDVAIAVKLPIAIDQMKVVQGNATQGHALWSNRFELINLDKLAEMVQHFIIDGSYILVSIISGRKFGKAIWDITGKRDVYIVFEHPGEATFPVSCLVVKRGGMVVFCAGTSGFNITFDARYVWMRQKRIQGSHFAHLKQASAANQFVLDRRIYPCMSEVLPWADIPRAHHMMWENEHKPGNMAVLVNAPQPGLKNLEDTLEVSR